mmetsp:Transcript_44617/g.112925  ORF Transcript_44617/g.112925 Transcript_44617/m.112925 type:complete len:149 (-) Transcript_44617:967-1413(-)
MTAAGCRYLTARLAVDCHNLLGEGAVWSRRRGTLLWVDIEGRLLQEMKPPAARGEAHKYTSWSLNERPGTVALTDRSNEVLLALEGDAALAALPQAHFRVVWRVRWYAISFLLGQPICICWLRNVVHTVDGILKAQEVFPFMILKRPL